jgi:REP element-mobilizing transposase RayT
MANSYTSLFVHVIFGTHNREPLLIPTIRERLWPYMGGIARENHMKALSVGGMLDHAHMLLKLSATMSVAKGVQLIKTVSSKWIHEHIEALRNFAWQEGYGAFTVAASDLDDVIAYIERQEEHHRLRTFQEEYIAFLKENKIEYDERYVWG